MSRAKQLIPTYKLFSADKSAEKREMFEKMNHWLTLVANLGVVASIIFLALEVRQTGNVAEAAARQEVAVGRKPTFLSTNAEVGFVPTADLKSRRWTSSSA